MGSKAQHTNTGKARAERRHVGGLQHDALFADTKTHCTSWKQKRTTVAFPRVSSDYKRRDESRKKKNVETTRTEKKTEREGQQLHIKAAC